MCVRGAGAEKYRVRMPGNGGDGAADGLLDVLGDPPVVLFLEVADSDNTSAGSDGEFGLGRRPADECSSTVNTEKNEGRFVARWRGFPDEGVTVW